MPLVFVENGRKKGKISFSTLSAMPSLRKESVPMKKLCSLFLCALLALQLLPAGILAASEMTTSDQGVAFIAGFEGYRQYAYSDGGKWYIGYGTACGQNDYPNGVTEEEALRLLQEELAEKEVEVNAFLTQYQITLSQTQFDALMSLTYNLGTGWLNPSYRLGAYLIDGWDTHTTDEMVNAIATWCHVGTEPQPALAQRRLTEAYLFLYGEYENNGAQSYVYLHFIPGDGAEVPHSTLFYPINHAYGSLPVPTGGSQIFQGWYTAGGTLLTADDVAVSNTDVTAHWGTAPADGDGTTSVSWTNPYSDVKESDWFYAYVKNLSLTGAVEGYPDGTFKPTREITVGEALKMVLLAAGETEQAMTDTHWASGYRDLAVQKGYLTAEQAADLDAVITRGVVAQLMALVMELPESTTTSPFADTSDQYVLRLYDAGLVTGSYNTQDQLVYRPDQGIVRSEISALVWRMHQYEPPVETPVEPEQPDNSGDGGGSDRPAEPDPEETGYITYGNKKIPILAGVPVCEYDKSLFRLEGSVLHYDDPAVDTYLGIDVSSYQGDIDWEAVAADGIEYAFVRVGFRGYATGSLNYDRYYEQNLQGAIDAGLDVGVYFFSQAITVEEAIAEAELVLDAIRDYNITYPVVFDWETVSSSSARTNNLDSSTLTDCAIAFCERVLADGYTPMVYFNQSVGYTKFQLDRLTDYDFWYAQYPKKDAMIPAMYYNYQIWQYSSSGTVAGISGGVDMNLSWKQW